MSGAQWRDWLHDKEKRYAAEKWLWICAVPVSWLTGLVDQVGFVSLLSIYALVITAGGAQQAARAAREAKDSS